MILPTVPVHSSGRFTWNGCSGVTDISDLAHREPWKQIYDDACDIGFYIFSERTSKKILFYMGRIDRDSDGDIQGWNFISLCGTYKILVVND